jgi:hypothetical protein
MNSEGIETYPNELNTLAVADDVNGNGVFDPNNSHGNIHPDEGVFADHQSIPGYMKRDHFYNPSEVFDIPGGGDVMYVPGGAVSFQQGQPETLRKQRLLWELPPSVNPFEPDPIPQDSTVNAPTATRPVSGFFEKKANVAVAVAAGVGIGAAILMWRARK